MPTQRLSRSEIFAYGLPGITINMVIVLFTIYLPKFYADVVGVNIQVVGTLILLARFVNAFIDPIIGIFSDHTNTRWGRRRPWIFVASIALALTFLLITAPPIGLTSTQSDMYFGGLLAIMLIALSSVEMPYYSLGAELSKSYHERNILMGVRGAMQNVGILTAPMIFIIITKLLNDTSLVSERVKFMWFGLCGFFIILLTCWFCVVNLREPTLSDKQRPHPGFFKHFSVLRDNKPFRLLVVITTLQFMGIACTTSLFLFFVEYVLKSQLGDYIILVYTLSVVAGIPIWIRIATRIDKRNAMVTALLLNFFVLVNILFIGPGDEFMYCILVAFYGITGGAVSFVLSPSMVADAIDYDEWQLGQRREGAHMGVLFFLGKIAMGISVIVVFSILNALGYERGQNQTPEVVQGIRYMFIAFPSCLGAIEVVLFLLYPINKQLHEKIRAEIDAR